MALLIVFIGARAIIDRAERGPIPETSNSNPKKDNSSNVLNEIQLIKSKGELNSLKN